MEKETKDPRAFMAAAPSAAADFVLQWGSRKRLRCVKVRRDGGAADGRRRRSNPFVVRGGEEKDFPAADPHPLVHRKSESAGSENKRSRSAAAAAASPEEEDWRYTLRGSSAGCDDNGNAGDERVAAAAGCDGAGGVASMVVLPRFFFPLSNKEKEEDFMAMKGCKLPQRPKKRPKLIQKCLLLVSPGAWLTELSQERYEVREKKSSRKKKKGLKAMCLESDSE